MGDDTAHPDLLGTLLILQGVAHNLITKELIHLFECATSILKVEEEVAESSNQAPYEEVEDLEPKILEGDRRALCEHQAEGLVRERG